MSDHKPTQEEFLEHLKSIEPHCSNTLEQRLREEIRNIPTVRETEPYAFPEKTRRRMFYGVLCGLVVGFLLGVFATKTFMPRTLTETQFVYVEVPQPEKKPEPKPPQKSIVQVPLFDEEWDSLLIAEEKRLRTLRHSIAENAVQPTPSYTPRLPLRREFPTF